MDGLTAKMIISHSKKFIFIHLEKCGGTSVEVSLQPYLKWDDIILGSTHFGENLQGLYFNRYGIDTVKNTMLWKHSNAKNIYDYLGTNIWNEYTKICVVRNPIDLTKSLYWFSQTAIALHTQRTDKKMWANMVKNNEWESKWPYGEAYVRSYITSFVNHSGFSGFVSDILEKNEDCIRPQLNRMSISAKNFDIDIVVDLTQLNSQWDNITRAIGIQDAVELKKANVSQKKTAIEKNTRIEKMIRRHFAADYEFMPDITGVIWM